MRVRRDEFALQTDTWDAQEKCDLCLVSRAAHKFAILPSVCRNCSDLPDWKIDLLGPDFTVGGSVDLTTTE